jgi:serine/threonine-protein kinase SRPK3
LLIAQQLRDLVEKQSLFRELVVEADYDDSFHLAYFIALFGRPPSELLRRGKPTSLFFDSNGMAVNGH